MTRDDLMDRLELSPPQTWPINFVKHDVFTLHLTVDGRDTIRIAFVAPRSTAAKSVGDLLDLFPDMLAQAEAAIRHGETGNA